MKRGIAVVLMMTILLGVFFQLPGSADAAELKQQNSQTCGVEHTEGNENACVGAEHNYQGKEYDATCLDYKKRCIPAQSARIPIRNTTG